MGILSVLIFALFCIFFLVTLVLSAWRWRWLNIVVMLFLFPTAATFIIMFANVAKKNFEQRGKLEQATRKLETENEKMRQTLTGLSPTEPANVWTRDSVLGMTHRLEEAELGRGRVWRDCQPDAPNGNKIQVTTFRAGALNPDGTEATVLPNNIQVPSLVYVFTQTAKTSANGVPNNYLGEFRITAATDTTATLEANLVLDAAEVSNSISFPWTLYELMPADTHLPFEKAETSDGSELSLDAKRDLLVSKYLTAESMGMDAESEEYKKLIDGYWLDTLPLGEIHELPGQAGFTPTDDEIWIEVEIIKDETVEVDAKVDVSTMLDSESFKNFTVRGLAQNPDLKLGRVIQLKKGEKYYFDKKTAIDGYVESSGNAFQSLIDKGVAKETGRKYLRKLNDYGSAYREVTLALDLLARELDVQEHHNADLDASTILATGEIDHRVDVRDRLEADQANLNNDQQTLDAAIAAEAKKLKASRDRIAKLETIIEEATTRIAKLEAEWAKEADARTRAAEQSTLFSQ